MRLRLKKRQILQLSTSSELFGFYRLLNSSLSNKINQKFLYKFEILLRFKNYINRLKKVKKEKIRFSRKKRPFKSLYTGFNSIFLHYFDFYFHNTSKEFFFSKSIFDQKKKKLFQKSQPIVPGQYFLNNSRSILPSQNLKKSRRTEDLLLSPPYHSVLPAKLSTNWGTTESLHPNFFLPLEANKVKSYELSRYSFLRRKASYFFDYYKFERVHSRYSRAFFSMDPPVIYFKFKNKQKNNYLKRKRSHYISQFKLHYGFANHKRFIRFLKRFRSNSRFYSTTFLTLLENRLEFCVYRLNFVPSPYFARQYIRTRKILVNLKPRINCNYILREGDIISFHPIVFFYQYFLIFRVFQLSYLPFSLPFNYEIDFKLLLAIYMRPPTVKEIEEPYFFRISNLSFF